MKNPFAGNEESSVSGASRATPNPPPSPEQSENWIKAYFLTLDRILNELWDKVWGPVTKFSVSNVVNIEKEATATEADKLKTLEEAAALHLENEKKQIEIEQALIDLEISRGKAEQERLKVEAIEELRAAWKQIVVVRSGSIAFDEEDLIKQIEEATGMDENMRQQLREVLRRAKQRDQSSGD